MAATSAETAAQNVISKVVTWGKRLGFLGLVLLIIIKLASAFPQIPGLIAIASIDWQAFGVFVAGSGYALSR